LAVKLVFKDFENSIKVISNSGNDAALGAALSLLVIINQIVAVLPVVNAIVVFFPRAGIISTSP